MPLDSPIIIIKLSLLFMQNLQRVSQKWCGTLELELTE